MTKRLLLSPAPDEALSGSSDGEDKGVSWLVDKIRRGERIEKPQKDPLFESLEDSVPLFIQAALLDSLHDMWRLNSEKLVYRLGVIMGHKLRVEVGEKLELEDVGTWEAAVQQVGKMLELFSEEVTIPKVARLYARFEVKGCPCSKMAFSLDYCPQDILIEGLMAGFAQWSLDDPKIYCKHNTCVQRKKEGGVCVHELRIQERD